MNEWSYERLQKLLETELPLTMTLGLMAILVKRMVLERMFTDRAEGVVDVVRSIVERTVREAAEEEEGRSEQ